MRRLLTLSIATAIATMLLPIAPSGATHACAEGIPCYPHICIDPKHIKEIYFC